MTILSQHTSRGNDQSVNLSYDNRVFKKAFIGIKKGGLLGAAIFCTLVVILVQQDIYLLNTDMLISLITSLLIGFIWGGIIGFLISPVISIRNNRNRGINHLS